MNTYKISLIFTVKNEEKTIKSLLDSILIQTKMPDEIIIVDGGSFDKTVKIIEKYKHLLPIKIIIKKGANVPEGRNIGISNSKYPIIAVTDGGCVLDKNWVFEITEPFKYKTIDIVSGKYIATGDSLLQKLTGILLMYDFNKVDSATFSPSSRSIAFKKSAWEQVKGYPEWLISGEDTYFNDKLRKIGKVFYLNKNAIVYWEPRDNLIKLFKQYFQYSYYDAIGLINPGYYFLRIASWFIFSLILIELLFYSLFQLLPILLIIPFFLLSFRVIYKLKNKMLNLKNYCYGLVILSIFELALLLGYFNGIFESIKRFLKILLRK